MPAPHTSSRYFNIACEENIDNNIHEGPSILTPQEDKNSQPLLTLEII